MRFVGAEQNCIGNGYPAIMTIIRFAIIEKLIVLDSILKQQNDITYVDFQSSVVNWVVAKTDERGTERTHRFVRPSLFSVLSLAFYP